MRKIEKKLFEDSFKATGRKAPVAVKNDRRRERKKGKTGFSLIELLAAIAVLGVLAAIAHGNYVKYINSSYVTAMKIEASEIRKVLEYIYSVDGDYHTRLYSAGYLVSGEPKAFGGFIQGRGAHNNKADGELCDRWPKTKAELKERHHRYFTLKYTGSGNDENSYEMGLLGAKNGHRICRYANQFGEECRYIDENDQRNKGTKWETYDFPQSYVNKSRPSGCAMFSDDMKDYTVGACGEYLFRVKAYARGVYFYLVADETGKICYIDSNEWRAEES